MPNQHERRGAARGADVRSRGGVQSVERAFSLLEVAAANGGEMSVSQLAEQLGLPAPTTHRIIRTLVDLGYMRQEASRHYVLGPRLMHLGEAATRALDMFCRPQLRKLVEEVGESANLAMLDGDQIVYVAQEQSERSMRMFTEVGRRVDPHCTAVGKAILAHMPENAVRGLLSRTGMQAETEHTLTDPEAFLARLAMVRDYGFALDEEEQEVGVRCVAVRVPDTPQRLAVSISGPATRMTEAVVGGAAAALRVAARDLAAQLR